MAFRAGVVALAVGLGLAAWLISRDNGEIAEGGETSERIVSAAELREAAAKLPYAVHWAGPVPGTAIELVESPSGTLIRYRDPDGEDDSASSLAVGSYPVADPVAELAEFAAQPGSRTVRDADGRKIVFDENQPTSVYFADQAGGVQVEVYDPSPRRALELARSARVRPLR